MTSWCRDCICANYTVDGSFIRCDEYAGIEREQGFCPKYRRGLPTLKEPENHVVFYNRETGEVFDRIEEAIADARDCYDFGDPTNPITYLGFPNDELPYIVVDPEKFGKLCKVFG